MLKMMHPEVKPNIDSLKNMHLGELMHGNLQSIFKEECSDKYLVEAEKDISITDTETDLVIHGRIDLLFREIGTSDGFIVELKTIKDMYFMEKEPKPHEQHIDQLMLYLRARKMDIGYIIYIDRKAMKTMTFEIKNDPERFNNILKAARKVYQCQRACEIAEKTSEEWRCKNCEHKQYCDDVEKTRSNDSDGNKGREDIHRPC